MFGSKKQTLRIDGMMCMHCAAHVEEALSKLPGVKGVKVNLEAKTATVKVADFIAKEVYEAAIKEAGYTLVEIA